MAKKRNWKTFYKPEDLKGKTPANVAEMIDGWRKDDSQGYDAACDLLNAIEAWLRGGVSEGRFLSPTDPGALG